MIVAAKYFPGPASFEGPVNLQTIADIGVTMVFLFYGLKLNLRTLKNDLKNWRLHLVVQISTFLLFPFIVLPLFLVFSEGENNFIWLGAFFLASLPSTVSSSVVMVSIAKGNVTSAIFNASLSSLLGIFLTPLWMGFVLATGPAQLTELSGIIVKLFIQVLLPVSTGLILNRYFSRFTEKKSPFFKVFDQSVILLIVYISFSQSFINDYFNSINSGDLLLIATLCLALFFTIYYSIGIICRKLKFNIKDTISAQFSGSKKSLVHGTVMSGVLFKGMAGVGVILLPLMIYHALQLIIVGFIANKKGEKSY